jgi:hypothetical protein
MQGSRTRGPPTVFLRPALLVKFKEYLIFQFKIMFLLLLATNAAHKAIFSQSPARGTFFSGNVLSSLKPMI